LGSSVAAKITPENKVARTYKKPLKKHLGLLVVRFINPFSKFSYCHARR
jgi:hypothetical protein